MTYNQHARRTRRQMSQSRAALNRSELPVSGAGPYDGEAYRAPAPHVPVEPVEHLTIEPEHSGWYRVMRILKSATTGLGYECIGEFPKLAPAIVFADSEKWRAVVNDWNGRRHFDSWRQLKPTP